MPPLLPLYCFEKYGTLLNPPRGVLDLVTNRQGAIYFVVYSASKESPGPDLEPGSGFMYFFSSPRGTGFSN